MSIHRTKTGTYRVRWRSLGQMQSKSFKRLIDAQQFTAQVTLGEHSGIPGTARDNVTFDAFTITWMSDYCEIQKTQSSVIRDRQLLRCHILPRLGKARLDRIQRRDLAAFQGELVRNRSLSSKSVNHVMGLIRKMLSDAVAWDYLKRNPAEGIRPIRSTPQEFKFWSKDECVRFQNICRRYNMLMADVVCFAHNTGLRSGEIEGLRRDCIDYERREITVRRSVCKRTKVLNEYTKSKRIRRVPLNEAAFSVLLPHRLKAPNQQIFEVRTENLARKPFKRMCRLAEVGVIRFHDLRHTFASHLVMAGVPIYTVKTLLGHSSVAMTERYSHLAPDQLKGVTEVLCENNRTASSFERIASSCL